MKLTSEKNNILKITLSVFVASFFLLGFSGSVMADWGCTDSSNGWNCEQWTYSPLTKTLCPNDYKYSRVDFATTAKTVRAEITPTGNWGTNCAVDCANSADCGVCECRCYGDDLYCADKWIQNGTAVAQSCSFKNISLTGASRDSRCLPVASFAAPVLNNGTCGANAKTYSASSTAWASNTEVGFCATGSNPASNPSFPAVGASASWTCSAGTVTASGSGTDASGGSITGYKWVIRTTANNNAGIYTKDIVYTTQNLSISNLAPDNYIVFLAVQARGIWGQYSWRAITVSPSVSCSATRSYYTCGGTAPNGTTQIMCPSDNASVTTATNWLNVGSTSASCTAGRKCEYYTQTYSCTGTNPLNATMCPSPNDASGLPANTVKDLVPSCGYTSSAIGIVSITPKCQFVCNSGYSYNPPTDTCVANAVPFECTGEIPGGSTTMCAGDNASLTETLEWAEAGDGPEDCSDRKCEYYTPAVVTGVCGVNAQTFPYTITAWPGTEDDDFCAVGNPPAGDPTFPADPGGSVTWTCSGSALGNDRNCSATRQRNLNWQETSPSN